MLRITSLSVKDSRSLKLEGSLKGPWVDELKQAWLASADEAPGKPVEVDLSGVTFTDSKGCNFLLDMQQAGARLVGASPFLRHVLNGKEQKPAGS